MVSLKQIFDDWVLPVTFNIALAIAFFYLVLWLMRWGEPTVKEWLIQDLNRYSAVTVELDVRGDPIEDSGAGLIQAQGIVPTKAIGKYLPFEKTTLWGNYIQGGKDYELDLTFPNNDKFSILFTVGQVVVLNEGPSNVNVDYYFTNRALNKQFLDYLFKDLGVTAEKRGKWK